MSNKNLKIVSGSLGGALLTIFQVKNNIDEFIQLPKEFYSFLLIVGIGLLLLTADIGGGFGVSFETFQKLAGALHVQESKGKELTTGQMAEIVIWSTFYGPAPAHGDVLYQYRMSKKGWDDRTKKPNKK